MLVLYCIHIKRINYISTQKWLLALVAGAIVLHGATIGIQRLKQQNIQSEVEIQELQNTAKELENQRLQEKTNLETKTQELDSTNQKLQQDLEKAKQDLQAKREEAEKRNAIARVVAPAVKAAPVSGSKADWMRAAGIPEAHWGYVDSIVSRESGWNPNAVNKSSGACGLGQQLPCGKWAGAWNDPVAALKAMTGYVNARYGGWAGAVSFWNANHWY